MKTNIKKICQFFSKMSIMVLPYFLITYTCLYLFPAKQELYWSSKEKLQYIPKGWEFFPQKVKELNFPYILLEDKKEVIKEKRGTIYLFNKKEKDDKRLNLAFIEESSGKNKAFFMDIQNIENKAFSNTWQEKTKFFEDPLGEEMIYYQYLKGKWTNLFSGYLFYILYIIIITIVYFLLEKKVRQKIDDKLSKKDKISFFLKFQKDWIFFLYQFEKS